MSSLNLIRPTVSSCKTHHLDQQGKPLYSQRFDQVLSFHEPGLAPVSLNGLAWHVCLNGTNAYAGRFERTFGFYCGFAAAIREGKWLHIRPDGQSLYAERYLFVGNFQDDYCTVCDTEGRYFHIDFCGQPLYPRRWRYCGDFREGVAVVQGNDGLSTHINVSGELVHGQWFMDLDVFHKGFARARDINGWHHVNQTGEPIYTQRYSQVEPFYNGCSRVEAQDGCLQVIEESGCVLRELRSGHRDRFVELSADMVGYWKTFTLSAAAELAVVDHLPTDTARLARALSTNAPRLERLLRALAELDVVTLVDDQWLVTEKGQYLSSTHPKTLKSAAIEYGHDLLDRWRALPSILRGKPVDQDIFTKVAATPQRCIEHHRMLASYALHDYSAIVDMLGIEPSDVVFDAAGGSGSLSRLLAEYYPDATFLCGDISPMPSNEDRVQQLEFDLFKPWPVQASKIILARVLHDWNDEQALQILCHARDSLLPDGEVLVLEMLLPEQGFDGALCDLHVLAVTGGRERSAHEYHALFNLAGLSLLSRAAGPGLVSVLRAGKLYG